mmetsp:Transcript_14029/g.42166  ORF Transcript_14029/g.42166 Transcript_14029/m.42166 type:complete len:87 (-) Transcript_14029:546-806(-)
MAITDEFLNGLFGCCETRARGARPGWSHESTTSRPTMFCTETDIWPGCEPLVAAASATICHIEAIAALGAEQPIFCVWACRQAPTR